MTNLPTKKATMTKKEEARWDNVYIPRPRPPTTAIVHEKEINTPREPPSKSALTVYSAPKDGCIAPPNSPVLGPSPCNIPCETELSVDLSVGLQVRMQVPRFQSLGGLNG